MDDPDTCISLELVVQVFPSLPVRLFITADTSLIAGATCELCEVRVTVESCEAVLLVMLLASSMPIK